MNKGSASPVEHSPLRQPGRFEVYENVAIASALSAKASAPSSCTYFSIILLCFGSGFLLLLFLYKTKMVEECLYSFGVQHHYAGKFVGICQTVIAMVFLGTVSALYKATAMLEAVDRSLTKTTDVSSYKRSGFVGLTEHQQGLLGVVSPPSLTGKEVKPEKAVSLKGTPKSGAAKSVPSPTLMVPVHAHPRSPKSPGVAASPWSSLEHGSPTAATQVSSLVTMPSVTKMQNVSFSYSSPPSRIETPSQSTASPWDLKQRTLVLKEEIRSEEELEGFLADVQNRFNESSSSSAPLSRSLISPPLAVQGVAGGSPSAIPFCVSTPAVGTPVRPLRVSPSPQKTASPKKGDGDFPPPMLAEQAIEGFHRLGVYPHIEQWRDSLRQWFSGQLLQPLLRKIDTSHIQVMGAAAKLGAHISINPLGAGKHNGSTTESSTLEGATQEWLTTFAPDEDGLLHQLRAALLHLRDAQPTSQPSLFGLRSPSQQESAINQLVQECLDAVTEHQRLSALLKCEWVKGLLPQNSVPAEYTVQRIRELAEGTCVKKYDYGGIGEAHEKSVKRWNVELPSDPHLLLYLFCALLEHPQWLLHVDPTSHPTTQSSNNPLFIASFPHKERFPEKYIAITSSVPAILHTGGCILAVSKQMSPTYALYWDRRLQFSLQGCTSLWDAILLLCYRIKTFHGGVVRGVNLGSSAINLLSIFDNMSGST